METIDAEKEMHELSKVTKRLAEIIRYIYTIK